jgi:spermidine synthase
MEEIESDFGIINILKNRSTGALIYDVDGSSQSVADGQGTSMASYIHAFFGLLTQAKARNILLIGCGGGTLATMLARARRNVTMVDINPASFTLAKRYFGLPDSVVCHIEDGKSFLRKDTATYDAIVLDAFLGDHIPLHLSSLRFFELVRDHLTARGAVFANVVVKNDFDDKADRVAHAMTKVWSNVRVLDSERVLGRNAIAMAGRVGHLRAPYVLVPPTTEASRIDKALALMKYRPWSIDRWGFVG